MTAGTASPVHPIDRIGVVGSGVMGSGVAEVCAAAGLDVLVAVRTPGAVDAGRRRVEASVEQGVRTARLTEAQQKSTMDLIGFTTDLADLADRDLVVEAIAESEPAKTGVFAALDRIVHRPGAILASTTSAIPIARLADATARPERVIGLHFFNPVPALPLVEVIGSALTSPASLATAESFVTDILGKQAIRVPDRAGFVVNALLIPFLLGAVRMVEAGVASPADIDKAMMLGCAHPVGPLRLVDLIGLDVVASVAQALYAEYNEPHYAAPPLLLRMVGEGRLGRKTGAGFHPYGDRR